MAAVGHLSGDRVNFRVVILGDTGVGKSSLAIRFVRDEFMEHNAPTVGAAYLQQAVKVGARTIKLDIWDTAGQERFSSLAPMYYRTAQAAVVVYDITRRPSFSRALDWLKELHTYASNCEVVALCGNKVDLAQHSRVVTYQEASNTASEKCLLFSEASGKTGVGVRETFDLIAQALCSKASSQAAETERDTIRPTTDSPSKSACPC